MCISYAYLPHVLYAFVPFVFLGSLANDEYYVANDKVAHVCLFFSLFGICSFCSSFLATFEF
jgi:hypothetical protein